MSEQRRNSAKRKELLESIDEIMLKIALLDNTDEEIEELEVSNANAESIARMEAFYERSEEGVLRIIRQTLRKSRINHFVKTQIPNIARTAAVIIAVVTIGFSTAFAVSPTVRIRLLEFIINIEKDHTELSLQENAELSFDVPVDWAGEYYPSRVPEGYMVTDIIDVAGVHKVHFANAEGKAIRFTEHDNDTYTSIDTEDAETELILIRGAPGLASLKNGIYTVMWTSEKKYFTTYFEGEKLDSIEFSESVIRIK